MSTEIVKLRAALETIADFFTDAYTYIDQDGVEQRKNDLYFEQIIALGAIPQTLQNNLEGDKDKKLKEAQRLLTIAQQNNDKTEIAQLEVASKLSVVEAIESKIYLEEAALEVCKEVYRKHIGKDWKFYRKVDKPQQDIRMDDLEARVARALGRRVNQAPGAGTNTPDGVEKVAMERLPDPTGAPRGSRK